MPPLYVRWRVLRPTRAFFRFLVVPRPLARLPMWHDRFTGFLTVPPGAGAPLGFGTWEEEKKVEVT